MPYQPPTPKKPSAPTRGKTVLKKSRSAAASNVAANTTTNSTTKSRAAPGSSSTTSSAHERGRAGKRKSSSSTASQDRLFFWTEPEPYMEHFNGFPGYRSPVSSPATPARSALEQERSSSKTGAESEIRRDSGTDLPQLGELDFEVGSVGSHAWAEDTALMIGLGALDVSDESESEQMSVSEEVVSPAPEPSRQQTEKRPSRFLELMEETGSEPWGWFSD